jgi:hypothetical protein
MARGMSHTANVKVLQQYGIDPSTRHLPLKRTAPGYRRRCTTCGKLIPRERKSSYCSPCNGARRAASRSHPGMYLPESLRQYGETTGDVLRALFSTGMS